MTFRRWKPWISKIRAMSPVISPYGNLWPRGALLRALQREEYNILGIYSNETADLGGARLQFFPAHVTVGIYILFFFLLVALCLFWVIFYLSWSWSGLSILTSLLNETFLGFELMESPGLDVKHLQNKWRTLSSSACPILSCSSCNSGH